MKNEVVPVQIRGILPANSGCALFIGNDEKVFVIQVEQQMGAIIRMFLSNAPKERPLTHDLINRIGDTHSDCQLARPSLRTIYGTEAASTPLAAISAAPRAPGGRGLVTLSKNSGATAAVNGANGKSR